MTEITVELEEYAREEMYQELLELFSEREIHKPLEEQVVAQITEMYDNKEQMKQQAEQNRQR